jgi:transporter family protein
MWVYLGIFSAVFLGMYDVSRKHALRQNAVLPVLFFAVVFGAVFVLPAVVVSKIDPEAMMRAGVLIPPVPWIEHLQLFVKAVIVAASWVLLYFALKHLPISIASPIYVAGPVWTLIGAIVLFREHPTVLQYAGFAVMVVSYYVFSVLGSKEGIIFHNNKWVLLTLFATVIGAASGLYDKYLIHTLGYSPVVVQAWFMIYLVPVLGVVVFLFWFPGRERYTPFAWRWSIPLIGGFLLVADFAYFRAICSDDCLIGILSMVRCGCVAVSFVAGATIFNEVRMPSKTFALAGLLGGMLLILLSK